MIYMGEDLEIKRHIDCDWLLEKREGIYCCCDTRSANRGKELTKKETLLEACQFFHYKKEEEEKIS